MFSIDILLNKALYDPKSTKAMDTAYNLTHNDA